MKLEEILLEKKKKRKKKKYGPDDLEDIKVRKGHSDLVKSTKVHDKDPRKKSRSRQKQEFRKEVRDYR